MEKPRNTPRPIQGKRSSSKRRKKAAPHREYDYDYLLVRLNKIIEERFGGISGFIKSKEYAEAGYTDRDDSKIYTYLSLPKDGGAKRVKSFPTLQKIYEILEGVELKKEIRIERVMVITTKNKL
tara:strand:+ start:10883 stop:11254 length:372 start_codon:yes stop_codon:yes gene_type:complete